MRIKRLLSKVLWKLFPKRMALRSLKIQHAKKLAQMQKRTAFTQEQWEQNIRARYQKATGHELNLEDPQRFTEKIQWRKLYGHDPRFSVLSDKYAVRDWVKQTIGEEYLIPLLGVWDRAEDIDFRKLPDRFVLKTNNGSAMNLIVNDKKDIDKREIKELLSFWLKIPFWSLSGELHYKSIPPKIIAEKNMLPQGKKDLADYKFFCFDGQPLYCQVITDRRENEHIDFFDMDWQHQSFVGLNARRTNSPYTLPCPKCFDEMKRLATALSQGFDFVRVDLYEIEGRVYFGEMTFTPGSGMGCFDPDEWDYKLGSYWKLQ